MCFLKVLLSASCRPIFRRPLVADLHTLHRVQGLELLLLHGLFCSRFFLVKTSDECQAALELGITLDVAMSYCSILYVYGLYCVEFLFCIDRRVAIITAIT